MPNEIPEGWQEKTLGQCALYINGYAFKPDDWHEYGTPIIRIEQLNNPEARHDYCPKPLPDKFVIDDGDLIFSWSATLSLKIWNRGKAYLNQHLYKVITKNSVDKLFLKYLIEFNLEKLAGETHGSTMKHITRPHLLGYQVIFPKTTEEQQEIASILQTVDNTIEKTKGLIEKHKMMKQGLMKDLFTKGVDENGKPHTEFKETELGRIPKEWTVNNLGSIGSFKNGINKDKDSFGFGTKFVNIIDAYPDDLNMENLDRINVSSEEISTYRLEEGDIIFVRSSVKPEGVGYNTVFHGYKKDVVYCGFMIRFRLYDKPQYSSDFFNYYFRNNEFRRRLLAFSTVSANTNINQESLKRLLCIVPPVEEQKRIVNILKTIDSEIHAKEKGAYKLIKLKAGLMQDLLTGRGAEGWQDD